MIFYMLENIGCSDKKTLEDILNSDRVLCDQFLENVNDDTLRRGLKRRLVPDAEMSFLTLQKVEIFVRHLHPTIVALCKDLPSLLHHCIN